MKGNKKHLQLLIACMFMQLLLWSQGVSIIPKPNMQVSGKGSFVLTKSTVIVMNDEGERKTVNFLNNYLKKYYGLTLKTIGRPKAPLSNYILVNTRRFIKAPGNADHYNLSVTPAFITIEGDSYSGTFYGMQSLVQLLPLQKHPLSVPSVTIDDAPRFAYRGLHLDVSRHFFPVDYVKRYIDYLALHKLNTFHWHLTDDQGWRVEIKKYPKLTSVGGYRNGTIIGRYPGKGNDSVRYGGFYTQQQIKDVVKYAADRFITVIPEIEMPGHSSAAIAAYPYLSCFPEEPTKAPAGTAWSGPDTGKQVQQAWGVFDDVYCAGNEQTFRFLQDVLDEVIPLFPARYVHIGGDENPKGNWKRCPKCQKRIKDNKLKNEHELQSYFTQRMEKYVNSKGKLIIGWDEILEGGLAPNATVMSWRGEQGGIDAATQNHEAIMTPEPYLYLNWSQTKNEDSVSFGRYTPIEKVYNYEPVPKKLDSTKAKYILGAQGNLWTEYINNTSILEYNLFPRLSALSEIVWSGKKDWNDFENRLMQQFKRYDFWNINYSKAYFEITYTVKPTGNFNGLALSFDEYKFKDYLQVFRDTMVSVPVYNVEGERIGNGVTEKTPVRFTDSLIINSDQPVYLVAGDTEDLTGAKSSQKLGFTYQTKLQFAFNKATGKKISLKTAASSTYPGNGGAFGLVNGLSGKDFNAKEWQGWNGKNMEAIIDLGKSQNISTIRVGVWSQEPSWIYLPKSIEVYTSNDGENWNKIATENNEGKQWPNNRKISIQLPTGTQTQLVKVVAINHGTIAAGRAGDGRPAWLFVDEIEID
jgi:hexosaminidase